MLYLRDEMLYLAMGDHLDLFRRQFPPMIPPEDQARSTILGNNYGRAATEALFGRQLGLPAALAQAARALPLARVSMPSLFRRQGPDWG